MLVWAGLGLVLALLTGAAALWRRSVRSEHFYESGVYGMTAASHARYALIAFALAAAFAGSYFWPAIPVEPLLAFTVLVSVLYFTSFLRGFSDQE